MIPNEYRFPDAAQRVLQSALTVTGGHNVTVALPVLGRGVLTMLMVAQLTGTLEGFTYTLYKSKDAVPVGIDQTPGALEPLFRVVGPVPVATSKNVFDGGAGWQNDGVSNLYVPFHNVDAPVGNSIPNLVYLNIAAAGSGSKTFGASLTICAPTQ